MQNWVQTRWHGSPEPELQWRRDSLLLMWNLALITIGLEAGGRNERAYLDASSYLSKMLGGSLSLKATLSSSEYLDNALHALMSQVLLLITIVLT